ncbi:hypothetical protein GCM10025768_11440 [Microbacterium pseudoresistens]|uniref:DUF2993 domain-containing protein n=1 Tax=Microbacterium pseudoresistens TaxID=640634 RepID=A0A7Y9EW55_9MICO|nr:DUF2993 domain-containing protein [Microbacterium pseudoresistens]NYD55047.1 hypothetical protein [Microbacterium pseudoresistens]
MGDTEPYPRDLGVAHPTVPLPREQAAVAAPRRRRRWPWVVGIVVVLAGLVVAGEFIARAVVADVVRSEAIKALELPEEQKIDVQSDGFVLLQLLSGRLDRLHVSSDEVRVGPLTGAVEAEGTGIPLRGGELSSAEATVRVTAAQLAAALTTTQLPLEEISITGSDVTASGTFDVLGVDVPISLTLTPDADDGDLVLTPVSASVVGATLDAAELRRQFGGLVDGLLDPRAVCIADRLPAGVHLRSLQAIDGELVAGFDIDGAIAADPALREKGTCD